MKNTFITDPHLFDFDMTADVFSTIHQSLSPIQNQMPRKNKTIRQLLNEFQRRYTIDELKQDDDLQRLYDYLAKQAKRADGKFFHEPDRAMCNLLERYLQYQPREILQKIQ